MVIEEQKYIWLDGELIEWNEAKVPILTHAMHYGTGVFEGIRAYAVDNNLLVFRLKDHMKRLMESAKMYYLEHKFSAEELENATLKLLKNNELKESSYIRPLIFVGYGGIGLNCTGFPVRVGIAAFPFGDYFANPEIRVCISNWKRISDDSMPPQAKACGNYLNSVIAKLDALKSGFDDAILLDKRDCVSEGTGENIFIVKDGKISTPGSSSSILMGITRDTVIEISKGLGYKVEERDINRFELYQADEVFFTGTAAEVTSIVEVDNRKISDGKMGSATSKIRSTYLDIVKGKDEEYKNWITEVY